MSDTPMDFSKAEFEGAGTQPGTCGSCSEALVGSYWVINGLVACTKCKDGVQAFGTTGSPVARTLKALALGCLGGAVGALLWYLVAHFLNLQAGLVSIAIGFLVGGGVRMGAERVGGWFYQLMAIGLSYVSIVAGWFPSVVEELRAEPDAATGPELYVVALIISIIAPVMNSVIGAFITAFALYEAWKLNKRPKFDITGPHALGAAPGPAGAMSLEAAGRLEPPPLPAPPPGSGTA